MTAIQNSIRGIQGSAASVWYCVVLCVALLSGSALAEDRWVEGQHYQILTPPWQWDAATM